MLPETLYTLPGRLKEAEARTNAATKLDLSFPHPRRAIGSRRPSPKGLIICRWLPDAL
jgi:hypothetical protein